MTLEEHLNGGNSAHSPDARGSCPDSIAQAEASSISADDFADPVVPHEPAGPLPLTSSGLREASTAHGLEKSKPRPQHSPRSRSKKKSLALPLYGSSNSDSELLSELGKLLNSEVTRAIRDCMSRYEQRLLQQEQQPLRQLRASGLGHAAAFSPRADCRGESVSELAGGVASVRFREDSARSIRKSSENSVVRCESSDRLTPQITAVSRASTSQVDDSRGTEDGKLTMKRMTTVSRHRTSGVRKGYFVNEMYHQHEGLMRRSMDSQSGHENHGHGEEPRIHSFFVALEIAVSIASVATAVLAGVQADVHWAHWSLLQIAFLFVFWCDIVVKMWVLGPLGYFRGSEKYSTVQSPRWNCFDFVVTFVSTFETLVDAIFLEHASGGGSSYKTVSISLRLLRIFRLTAFARLEIAKDLSAMLYGFVWGFLPLCWAMSILLTASYACGLALRMSVGEPGSDSPHYGPAYFGDVKTAVFNVFRCFHGDCTTEDGEPLVLKIGKDYGWLPKLAYTVVTLIITIGLANVVLALFTERIIEGAKFNESMRRRLHRKEEEFKKKMEGHMEFIVQHAQEFYDQHHQEVPYGRDAYGQKAMLLTSSCFVALVEHPLFIALVDRMGVKLTDFPVTAHDLFLVLSPDGEPITVSELLDEITGLRGEARVTLQMLTLSLQMKALRRQSRMAVTLELILDACRRVSLSSV